MILKRVKGRLHPQLKRPDPAHLAAIVTASPDAILSVATADGRLLSWNPGAEAMFGFSAAEATAHSFELIAPPLQKKDYAGLLKKVSTERQPATLDTAARRRDGTSIEVEISASPLFDAQGNVSAVAAICRDASGRSRDTQRQLRLMHELSHRSKNLFAVINSVARLTLACATSIDGAKESLAGRLDAMQRAYGRLTEAGFEGERLNDLLHTELAAFDGRIMLQGPAIMLSGKAAQTFALLVHELATNASKYGALSIPAGHVEISWSVEGLAASKRFRFSWAEIDGPPVLPPKRTGFGSKLITSVASFDFDCKPDLSYETGGFRYGFETLLSQLGTDIEATPIRRRLKSELLVTLYEQWTGGLGLRGELPDYRNFDGGPFEASGALTVASVCGDCSVNFVKTGRIALDQLGEPFRNETIGDETGALTDIYQRCAKSARPDYEQITFDFEVGDSITFERLLLPYSDGAASVAYLVGLSAFTGKMSSSIEISCA